MFRFQNRGKRFIKVARKRSDQELSKKAHVRGIFYGTPLADDR